MIKENSISEIRLLPIDNSKDLYFKIIGHEDKKSLPTLEELPAQLTLPAEIMELFTASLDATLNQGVEFGTLIDMKSGELKTLNQRGSEKSAPQLNLWLRALGQNTATFFLHTHTNYLGKDKPNDSFPSNGEIELFRKLNRSAYIFAIASERDTTLLVQTSKSYDYGWRNLISTTYTGAQLAYKLTILSNEAENEVVNLHKLSTTKGILDSEYRHDVIERLIVKAAPVLAEAGWGFYQYKGDVRKSSGDDCFLKMN